MPGIDWIPLVSQVKALAQAATGDTEGAARTMENFARECPGVSQVTSVVQLCSGDVQGAMETQQKCFGTVSNVANGIPVVGHAKGLIHHALGDHEGGDQALNAATRTTVVMATGAAAGITTGGLAAIPAGIAAGVAYDATGSAITGKPEGYMAAIEAVIENPSAGNIIDALAIPVGDGMAGYSGGQIGNRIHLNHLEDLRAAAMEKMESATTSADAIKYASEVKSLTAEINRIQNGPVNVNEPKGPKGPKQGSIGNEPKGPNQASILKEAKIQHLEDLKASALEKMESAATSGDALKYGAEAKALHAEINNLKHGAPHFTDNPKVTPGKATAGKATAGTATAGKATPGTATAGKATPGTATAGKATPGTATAGKATAGTATAGKATPGTATAGKATPGTATAGKATPGTATPGKATPGTATAGKATAGTATAGKATPGTSTPNVRVTPVTGYINEDEWEQGASASTSARFCRAGTCVEKEDAIHYDSYVEVIATAGNQRAQAQEKMREGDKKSASGNLRESYKNVEFTTSGKLAESLQSARDPKRPHDNDWRASLRRLFNWSWLPLEMPEEFNYTAVAQVNSVYTGLYHSFIRHSLEWRRVIPSLAPQIRRLAPIMSEIERTTAADTVYDAADARAAFVEARNRLRSENQNSYNDVQAAMIDIQLEQHRFIEQYLTYENYLGRSVTTNGQQRLYFRVQTPSGPQAMVVNLSDNLYQPLAENTRPVRMLMTVYFETWAEFTFHGLLETKEEMEDNKNKETEKNKKV